MKIRKSELWLIIFLLWIGACLLGRESPSFSHPNHLPPLSYGEEGEFYLLGTSKDGKDLLNSILYGGKFSIGMGLLTTLLIGLLGIGVGGWMAWGDPHKFKLGFFRLLGWGIGGMLGYFYAFHLRVYTISEAAERGNWKGLGELLLSLLLFLALIWVMGQGGGWLDRRTGWNFGASRDGFLLWLLQVLDSLPALLLIVGVVAIFQERSLWIVMLVIAFTSWAGIALLTRGEILKERELPYVEAARMLGYSRPYIFFCHLLPNIFPSLAVVLFLTVGKVIVAESSLSFLGLVDDFEGWGQLLRESREYPQYPWLGIFPGLALAITLILLHQIGERFKVFGEKNKL